MHSCQVSQTPAPHETIDFFWEATFFFRVVSYSTAPLAMSPKLIFSDIDGTLVHIADDKLQRYGTLSEDGRVFRVAEESTGPALAVRPLPVSSTGTVAFISEKTLKLVAELRKKGHIFVLISGARSSTFMERLPYLPAADAYVTLFVEGRSVLCLFNMGKMIFCLFHHLFWILLPWEIQEYPLPHATTLKAETNGG